MEQPQSPHVGMPPSIHGRLSRKILAQHSLTIPEAGHPNTPFTNRPHKGNCAQRVLPVQLLSACLCLVYCDLCFCMSGMVAIGLLLVWLSLYKAPLVFFQETNTVECELFVYMTVLCKPNACTGLFVCGTAAPWLRWING